MKTIRKLGLPFKLDQLTEGLGNCFPIAIIQQLRRPEIASRLNRVTTQITKQRTGPSLLRHCVKQFIKTSEHENVARFKQYYEETEGNRETWTEYWKRMTGNKVWVDSWFVQATAWYLKLDLWIVDCANRDDHPFIRISGNLENPDTPCDGPIMTIGTKSSCHYQSLLPVEMLHMSGKQLPINSVKEPEQMFTETDNKETQSDVKIKEELHTIPNYVKENPPELNLGNKMNKDETINTKKCTRSQTREKELSQKCNIEDQADHQPFIYELDGVILVFLCMSEDYIMKCPICKKETKYIVQHVAQNKTCQNYVKPDEFKEQFTIFKKNEDNKR